MLSIVCTTLIGCDVAGWHGSAWIHSWTSFVTNLASRLSFNALTFTIDEHNVKALGVDLSKVDFAVLSHYHADHFSGFDYLLKVNPNVKIYLPDEPELGAPVDFKFSNESHDDLKGLAPEEMYFGGTKSSMVYRASGSFPHSNHEFVTSIEKLRPESFSSQLMLRQWVSSTPTRRIPKSIPNWTACRSCRWR